MAFDRQRGRPYNERICVHCGEMDTLVHHYVFCPVAVRVNISVQSLREFLVALLGDSESGSSDSLLSQVEPCLLEHP